MIWTQETKGITSKFNQFWYWVKKKTYIYVCVYIYIYALLYIYIYIKNYTSQEMVAFG